MFNFNKITDLGSLGYAFLSIDPNAPIYTPIQSVLASAPIVSQGAVDEIVKMTVGVLVAALSRWLFNVIERKKEKKKDPELQPIQETTENNSNQNLNINE